jgi:hypothetical protein
VDSRGAQLSDRPGCVNASQHSARGLKVAFDSLIGACEYLGLECDFQFPDPKARILRSLVQIAGPQPRAGKQVTRLPLRGNGLSHSSPDRAFVAPTGRTRDPRESLARPCGVVPPGPKAARAPYPGAHTAAARSLPLRPPQAIVAPRPQLRERIGMAHPRSAIYTVEGESRRPGIDPP